MANRPRRLRVAALLIVASVTGCGGSPPPSASDAASPAALDLGTVTWLAARPTEQDDRPTGLHLRLVDGDGTTGWSAQLTMVPDAPAGGIPVLSGPRNGRLVYATGDGSETTIHVADVRGGSTVSAASLTGTVLAGALDASGSAVYLLVDGTDPGVHRLALDGDRAITNIAPLPPIRPSAFDAPWSLMRLTPDGRHLVIELCGGLGTCWWRVIDLGGGDSRDIRPDGTGPMIDLSNDTLLVSDTGCTAGPCPFLLVDLRGGEVRHWDPGAHNAALAIREDGTTALLNDAFGIGDGSGPITLTDPTTMNARVLHAGTVPSGFLGLARAGQREWAPPGWTVAAPPGTNLGEVIGPVLIRLSDGLALTLPAPNDP